MSEIFWTAITGVFTAILAIFTFLLWWVGRRQLTALNHTNNEELLHTLKVDFFTNEARELLLLLEYDLIAFKSISLGNDSDYELGFFERKDIGDESVRKILNGFMSAKHCFSSYEMDDFLLMHLEDLGFSFRKNVIKIKDIDQLFGYYICVLFESCEIKKYMEWARQDDKDIYSNFQYLYHKLKLYQNKGIDRSH